MKIIITKKILLIIILFSITYLISCNKSENDFKISNFVKFNKNDKKTNKSNTQTNYQVMSEYTRIISVGFIDIVNNNEYMDIIYEALNNEVTQSDINDFEITLTKLNTIFNENGINLKNEIVNSLKNNNHHDYVDIFTNSLYSLDLGSFKHNVSIFIPSMNTNYYPNINLNNSYSIGNTIYNLSNENDFPTINLANNELIYRNMDYIEDEPVFLISSIITDIDIPSIEINTNITQACGRCQESTSTGWCNFQGRGCKCTLNPIIPIEENINNLKNQIN